MAKIKTLPKKPELPKEQNNKAKLIKALMIGGTFAAIVALSMLAQGSGDTRPGIGVILVRIGLLSIFTVAYFVMLSRTHAERKDDKQGRKSGKS